MPSDHSDSSPPFKRIAANLREAIHSGAYQPGDPLPSQESLATKFDVSRATVQNALRLLRAENLITGKSGVGTFVKALPVLDAGLRPHREHLEDALSSGDATIDFTGYTAETLCGALTGPFDQMRSREAEPYALRIRLLLSDVMDSPVPTTVDPEKEHLLAQVRARSVAIRDHYTQVLKDTVAELIALGRLSEGTVEVRTLKTVPTLKLVLINSAEVFWGIYPMGNLTVDIGGESVLLRDALGKDAVLFHREVGDRHEESSQQVAAFQAWFDSTWEHVAQGSNTAAKR